MVLLSDVLFAAGSVIMMYAPTIEMLMAGRVIVGFGVGISSVIVPVYISEVCPIQIRGAVVAAETLFIPIGQFVSCIVSLSFGSNWRHMFGIATMPAMIQLFGMVFMPESPRWLAKYRHD